MKPNFVTTFFIIYLLYLQNASAYNYELSCSYNDSKETINCVTDKKLSTLEYSGDKNNPIIPCINESVYVEYYKCSKDDALKIPLWVTTKPNGDTNYKEGFGYACGKGNFLIGTKCYSCADKTGVERATTEEDAVTSIKNCYIPEGESITDEKGTFHYLSNAFFSCTDDNDFLCQSNA